MDMIYIGSDHGGYAAKEFIKNWLKKNDLKCSDLGTDSEESADYPIFAERVGRSVVRHKTRGILICKSGQGMSIAVNKIKGVRACVAWNEEVAKMSREHNNSNVLCLPASYIDNKIIVKILSVWLKTSFSEETRHSNRIEMIDKIESQIN